MRGMAFALLAEIIIGVASLLVLMMLFTPFPKVLAEGYCYMHNGFIAAIPFPDEMRPSPPGFCDTQEMKGFERVYIRDTSVKVISTRIASYALACLKYSGDATKDEDIVCYEIYLDEVVGDVTWADVLYVIPDEYKKYFSYTGGPVSSNSLLAIHYDADEGKVIVE